MKKFLRGSVPVLVIGANPGGIAIAKGLIDAGIPVTLLGEGRPLGGIGALLMNGTRQVPVWPPAYQDYEPAEWTALSLMLSGAHAKGVCLQPEERVRQVRMEGKRIIEVTTEGLLGKVKRRPRAVVLSSRLDLFLEKVEPPMEVLTSKQKASLTYETDVVVQMRWSGGPSPNPSPSFPENSPWGFMNCAPVQRKQTLSSWAVFARNRCPGDTRPEQAQMMLLRALFGEVDVDKIGLQDWDTETRFVKDVRPAKASASMLKKINTSLGATENLVRVGPLATLQESTMREEISQATNLVQSWLKD